MNTGLNLTCFRQDQLPEIAKQIIAFAGDHKLFLIDAPMGAGKTTLIKELCKQLGSHDHFSSPSYAIVNEYESNRGKLYHFDLYRIKNNEELFDLGIDEYLGSGSYCFFEWPEEVLPLLDSGYVNIEIDVKENIRYFRVFKF